MPSKPYFAVTELKQQAAKLGVKKIDANAGGGRIVFNANPNINAEVLIGLIQKEAQAYKFDGADKLRFIKPFDTTEQKLDFIGDLLNKLTLT